MIPIYEITNEELSLYKFQRIAQDVGGPSYTELWLTDDGGRIIKLFSTDEAIQYACAADIRNDISTLLALSNSADFFGSRFVLPDMIYEQHSEIVGYSMPYIRGTPLSQAKSLKMSEFKRIVRQIYNDVIFVNKDVGFSFADLHEENIILGADGCVYHIDLDGWYCGDGNGRRSRYLAFQKEKLASFPSRYRIDKRGNIIPNQYTDMFCLMQIIFNYLLQAEFGFAEMLGDEQESYLQYITKCCGWTDIDRIYKSFFLNEDIRFNEQTVMALPQDIRWFSHNEFIKRTSQFRKVTDAEEYLRQNELKLKKLFPDRIILQLPVTNDH